MIYPVNEMNEVPKNELTLITEDLFEYALCCLPPNRLTHCYQLSEIFDHTGTGEPIWFHFGKVGLKYYGYTGPEKEAVHVFARLHAPFPPARVSGMRTDALSCVSFELQAPGHRGAQNFSAYPQENNVNKILVQSDKRIGYYFKDTGDFQLSKSRSGGSYNPHLSLDKLVWARLNDKERDELNAWLEKPREAKKPAYVVIGNGTILEG